MTNREHFEIELEAAYRDLFASDPQYHYAAATTTPGALAAKMAESLMKGSASIDGEGIKRACRHFKIKRTKGAILEFLNGSV